MTTASHLVPPSQRIIVRTRKTPPLRVLRDSTLINLTGKERERRIPTCLSFQVRKCLTPKHRILCDVPCTALGLRPRFSYESSCAKSIQSTAAYQRQFLETAFRLAKKPGGEIVYSTCSITLAENERVVADFLSDHRGEVKTNSNLFSLPLLPI